MICKFSFWSIIKPNVSYKTYYYWFLMCISVTSPWQILHIHTIVDMFCLKWTSHCISHCRNLLWQNKSTIVYLYIMKWGYQYYDNLQISMPNFPIFLSQYSEDAGKYHIKLSYKFSINQTSVQGYSVKFKSTKMAW